MDTMSEENRALTDKFMLRLPDGMRDRLKHEAVLNKRSLNAEIIARLEQTLTEQDADPAFPILAPGTDIEITAEQFADLLGKYAKTIQSALQKHRKSKDAE